MCFYCCYYEIALTQSWHSTPKQLWIKNGQNILIVRYMMCTLSSSESMRCDQERKCRTDERRVSAKKEKEDKFLSIPEMLLSKSQLLFT